MQSEIICQGKLQSARGCLAVQKQLGKPSITGCQKMYEKLLTKQENFMTILWATMVL